MASGCCSAHCEAGGQGAGDVAAGRPSGPVRALRFRDSAPACACRWLANAQRYAAGAPGMIPTRPCRPRRSSCCGTQVSTTACDRRVSLPSVCVVSRWALLLSCCRRPHGSGAGLRRPGAERRHLLALLPRPPSPRRHPGARDHANRPAGRPLARRAHGRHHRRPLRQREAQSSR